MATGFLNIAGFLPVQGWLIVSPDLGFFGDVEWSLAALFCVTAAILWRHLAAGREDERLRARLQDVGKGAPPDAGPVEKRSWAR